MHSPCVVRGALYSNGVTEASITFNRRARSMICRASEGAWGGLGKRARLCALPLSSSYIDIVCMLSVGFHAIDFEV